MVCYCPLDPKSEAKKRLAELAPIYAKLPMHRWHLRKREENIKRKEISDSEKGDKIAGLLIFI